MSEPQHTNPHHQDQVQNADQPGDADASTRARQRAVLSLFTNVMDAGALTGPARDAKIAETVSLIRDTPSLGEVFDALLLDDLEDEPALFDEVREAMLLASDPYTGVIPDDHVFAPDIQAVIDTAPELQEYREELIADARAADDRRWGVLAADAQRRIDARPTSAAQHTSGPRPRVRPTPFVDTAFWNRRDVGVSRQWVVDLPRAGAGNMTAFVTRDALARDEPPKSQVIYNDEPTYRLNENRYCDESGKIEVVLDLFKPGTEEPLATSRDDWRVFPMLDGEILPIEPSEDTPTAWRLADLIAPDELARVTYDVALPTDEEPATRA